MKLYEEKLEIEAFIKELEQSRSKLDNEERRIKADLEATEEEIQDFQKEKMAKLNILKIPIVLKIKQIQNLVPNDHEIRKHRGDNENYLENPEQEPLGYFLPKDLSTSTLFTNQQL